MPLGDHSIVLPSRGALYGGRIPDGKVEIKRLSAYDLALLNTAGGESSDRINKIIENVSTLPNGFKHIDLLAADRLYILIAARCLSFGSGHDVDHRCSSCGASQRSRIDIIQALNERPLVPDLMEPFEVQLKDAGQAVAVRFLRGSDEAQVAKYTKKMASARSDIADLARIHQIAHMLVKVDGAELPSDPVKRERFVADMSAADFAKLEAEVTRCEPGIDTSVDLECQRCGFTEKVGLPVTLDFFRPPAADR